MITGRAYALPLFSPCLSTLCPWPVSKRTTRTVSERKHLEHLSITLTNGTSLTLSPYSFLDMFTEQLRAIMDYKVALGMNKEEIAQGMMYTIMTHLELPKSDANIAFIRAKMAVYSPNISLSNIEEHQQL